MREKTIYCGLNIIKKHLKIEKIKAFLDKKDDDLYLIGTQFI